MVRFPPCVDMTHLRACPLVGRLRARDVRTRVSASGRIGPEGAGPPAPAVRPVSVSPGAGVPGVGAARNHGGQAGRFRRKINVVPETCATLNRE